MALSERSILPYSPPEPKDAPPVEPPPALVRFDQKTDPRLRAIELTAPVETPAPPPAETPPPVAFRPAPPPPVPLYLRDPGPPPRLPRNQNVKSYDRLSYRFTNVERNPIRYRPLLWVCAAIGVLLLYVLIVLKPQNRLSADPLGNELAAAVEAATTTPSRPTVRPVPLAEQFAVVIAEEGAVLEEPHEKAVPVQTLSQYTFIAFQRKSSDNWYQLKGGSGWIKAGLVKTFETEEAAWDFKRAQEKPLTKKP